ncbi:methylenetetrahydrofolate--tRNA-(uracil(54)-C(5))-methyltransferase (FADH(2)-oxidizing) TrmFO [Thermanaerosceptrum fracticalcis]|uniref:Methylenetetrahydrofolate--tRNA-(uracil-5-)-methyltransferase TrmFO n=1 Tax=Thermanaerosceptrum fracticalcis TaxID=1712410 RepID=A0A7G6E127_THEFR|nr:methylenetetrahydrofolate--tRNA-(uracil(54)-C(5))-methyltransferase (FADH(2)-oxidizing) TrmFO [Thermanaerosceptrum fracticalcis]QNB45781.1 methylenetetrahydrofolate--tRNA-(uracil(54)-C(5))-methyltransferase (FADH(2)-oxidizing) TrmFO [Thermanaerosceptrum fracticalcis]
MDAVTVIGAGLAGSEAAWQIAQRGIKVKLYEMRPDKMTPAHHTPYFAELVCSNSLRANNLENAVGLLKEEMRRLNSLIMLCADENAVAAGGALAVDRTGFSQAVTKRLQEHPLVEIIREEVKMLPRDGVTVLASGPLTSEALVDDLRKLTGTDYLYFYDAAAPIVDGETINYDKVFWGSRYNKGTADYLNCPMNQEEYERFYQALISAEVHKLHDFEKEIYFEGCMPVEVMASRGPQTLLFGPLKPVGLADPRTNTRPYAVVQLRKDNAAGTLFNLVGFQTHLKWGEQQRVFRMIPGLEEAEFVRYGVMHRNTYINAPQLLEMTTQLKTRHNLLIAGQISGVEGYVESAASGLISGINASRLARQQEPLVPPRNSAIGSLLYYITHASTGDFQPMNITFGLIPPWPEKIKDKKAKNLRIAKRALEEVEMWKNKVT